MPIELRLSIRATACVGALLSWAGAAAADGYVVPKPVVVAPVATWTGCYGGVDDGYKWGRTRLTTPTPYTLNNPTPFRTAGIGNVVNTFPANAPATTGTVSQNTDGFVLGGQVGCNYQVTPGLVIGIETSGTADWAKDPTGSNVYSTSPGTQGKQLGTLSTEVERTCQFRIGPRIGTTLSMGTGLAPLIYGTGGYEGACYKTTQSGHINLTGITNTNVSSSDFESGWFAGGGIDMPTPFLIPSTFVQIEYSHAETSGSGIALAGTTTTGKLENTTDEVRVGFKYLFPVASYAGGSLK
jgi:outer membrane immunogenic protein